jgi:hypothetical protein
MFFIMAFIVAASATLSAVESVSQGSYSANSQRTNTQVFKHELFVLAAEKYMTKNPSSTSQLSWAQLKTVMPPAFANGSYSQEFKVKVVGTQKYIVCGRLTLDAATNVAMQAQTKFYTRPLGEGYFATASDEAILNSFASQCRA